MLKSFFDYIKDKKITKTQIANGINVNPRLINKKTLEKKKNYELLKSSYKEAC